MKETPYAWVVVWATFVCLALIFGVSYSFAAFFESFAVEFSAQRADVSWIFGLSGFVYFVMGAGGGMLADRFGPRIVCSAGMALIALGLLATSWATSLLTVYVSYGLLVGLGIALVYTPSIASVQPWFTTRRGLAGGIASSGVGAGTLLVPVLVAMAIGPMPWREAMQVLALGVFTVIGLGLSSPYLILSLAPKLVKMLPRPGAWMESFKQGMSFLLFATVGYMLWTLGGLVSEWQLLMTIFGLVLVSLACWIYGRWCLPYKSV
jgi:MFS family permease